jgi:hypothetical protein
VESQTQLLIIAVFPSTKLWQDVRYGAEEESEEISGCEGSEGIGARKGGLAAGREGGPPEKEEDGKVQANTEEAPGRIGRVTLILLAGCCDAQLNVAVTIVSVCNRRVQVEVPVQSPPDHPPKVEGATGVAARVTVVPLGKLSMQLTAVLAQEKPEVELVTVPVPEPEKSTVSVGSAAPPPLPVLVKQTTLAVM